MKASVMTITILLLLSFTMVHAQDPVLKIGDDMPTFDRGDAHAMETWEGQGKNGQLDYYYYNKKKEIPKFVVVYRDCEGKTEKLPFAIFSFFGRMVYLDNHPIDGKIDAILTKGLDKLKNMKWMVAGVYMYAPPCSREMVKPLKDLEVGDDMPNVVRDRKLFYVFAQWGSPDKSKHGGAILYYSRKDDPSSFVSYEAYLICDKDLADFPFGVYVVSNSTLYLDNIRTDGKIDSMKIVGDNEQLMVYEVAPECK